MTDYTELVKALRCCDEYALCNDCPIFETCDGDVDKAMAIAADAIEDLNRLVDLNTERCEGLREQLRKAQEQYEKHLNELEQQLPKRGEWLPGREISRSYIGDCCVSIDFEDWRCSSCGCVVEIPCNPKYNYCPNCGAKMEEETNADRLD